MCTQNNQPWPTAVVKIRKGCGDDQRRALYASLLTFVPSASAQKASAGAKPTVTSSSPFILLHLVEFHPVCGNGVVT